VGLSLHSRAKNSEKAQNLKVAVAWERLRNKAIEAE
jgi:hypothetical protein